MASINLGSSLVKTVMLKVIGDGGDANRMLDEIAAKAEALQQEHPELTVQINRAKAMADATVMKAEMRALLEKDPIKVTVDVDRSKLSILGNFLKSLATPRGWGSLVGNVPAEAGGVGGAGGIAKFLLSPAGLLAGTLATFAASPLIVTLLGGLVGAAGAAGAFKIASNANTNLTALQATQATAQQAVAQAQQQQKYYPSPANAAALATAVTNLAQASLAVTAFQQANAPALGLYGAVQNLGSAASSAFMTAILGNATRTVQSSAAAHHGSGGRIAEQIPGTSFLTGIGGIVGQLTRFVSTVGPQLGQLFRASLPYVDAFVKILEGFASRVIPAVISALGHFSRFLPDIVHLFNGVSDAVAAVIRALGWMAESVGIFGQAVLRFVRDVKHWYDDLNKWTGDLIKSFLNWFGSIAPALYQIGKDAIQGLIRGLENIPVIGTAISIGSKLIGGIKSVLGIRSPSTVAMGLGRNFTEGFYIGLGQAGQGAGVSVRGAGGSGAAGSGGGWQLRPGAGGVLEQAIVQIIRTYVVSHGGGSKNSVQVAFGQTH